MQSLVESGVLPLNATAFESPFVRLQANWFLTMERAVALTYEDSHAAAEIIAFVVDSISSWYSEHEEESWYDAEFPTEWRRC